MKTNKKSALKAFLITLGAVIAINIAGNYVYKRIDLTNDQRYTLSQTTKDILQNVDESLTIEVYLEGQFPSSFKKLQTETRQLLDEYSSINSNIHFEFVNPLEGANEQEKLSKAEELYVNGMRPLNITVNEKGKQSQEMVFPWAVANYNSKQVKIPLLKNTMAMTTEETVNTSVQHLEYAISDAIKKVTTEKSKKLQ